jgi:hypothetical protein
MPEGVTCGGHNSPKSTPHASTRQKDQMTGRHKFVMAVTCSNWSWSMSLVRLTAKVFHGAALPPAEEETTPPSFGC